jgi:hypothetical protein
LKKINIIVVSITFILIITVLCLKIFVQNNGKPIHTTNLKNQYNYIMTCSKPSIIIFSYDADCCENTKSFFDEVKKILDEVVRQ